MSWRPEDWDEYKKRMDSDEILNQDDYLDRVVEASADAMLEAVVERLEKEGLACAIDPFGHVYFCAKGRATHLLLQPETLQALRQGAGG